ncbi:hypothetical protein C8Q74DRAFT_224696 [Fomes fomentarius]|nr:hypothetical protein C8Q74DRAFT_224696 [Fomes fomentarius]
MVGHLCVLQYGFTTDQVNSTSAIDCASLYYARRNIMESPRLLGVMYKNKEKRWLLVGGAAFFRTGTPAPRLVLDAEIKAYLDHWFPLDLRHRDEFKGICYWQVLWPRHVRPYGFILHKMRMVSKKYREEWREERRQWIAEEKAKGVTNPLCSRFCGPQALDPSCRRSLSSVRSSSQHSLGHPLSPFHRRASRPSFMTATIKRDGYGYS